MWGFALCVDPREWRIGKCDAYDDRQGLVVGVWYCFGPFAITYDWE